MRPELQLTVKPHQSDDYSRVQLVATVTNSHGVDHDVVLYDQIRIVQPLNAGVGVELWTLATMSNLWTTIDRALNALIAYGELTLMGEDDKQQEPLF